MKINEEKYFASLVGVWCKVEAIDGTEIIHEFPTNEWSVKLSVLEGEYRPSLFTCWLACVYPGRVKITPLEPPNL